MVNSNLLLVSAGLVGMYIALGIVLVFVAVFLGMVPLKVWLRTLISGCHISMGKLVGMRLRKLDCKLIIDNYILAQKAGLSITVSDLETHFMAGGHIDKLVDALIAAHSAKLDLTLEQAIAIDLADKDVVQAVQTSIRPKVVKTPVMQAVARNGIELKVVAQVTLKARMDKQIGSADEETIIARVGEGVVASVGVAEKHTDILANPSIISQAVLSRHLDKNTAFEILSIDICDIDVGANVGANLRIADAEAKKKIAQAAAEERKAQAIAHEQEMKAKTQEMKAVVLAAESEVHRAMAKALNKGKIGAMDYYRLQNIVADTNMRNSFTTNKDNKPRNNE